MLMARSSLLSAAAVLVSGAALIAAEPTGPSLVAQVQEDLRAANDARSRQGAEVQAWHLEQERLATTVEGLQAEIARIEHELAAAETERTALRAEQERRGSGAVPAAQQALAAAARATCAALQEAAATVLPGLLSVPTDDTLDGALKAIELSERAADQVTVEIVAGHRDGSDGTASSGSTEARTAVRLLRVGGLGWWMALDGGDAGTATMVAGRLELTPVADAAERAAISRAIAMAEGRMVAELVALPLAPGVGGAP